MDYDNFNKLSFATCYLLFYFKSFQENITSLLGNIPMAKYSARAGFINLQEEDVITAIENIYEKECKFELDHTLLRGAAESTQKRNASEILKRLRKAPRSIWEEIPGLPSKERRIALYYLILKTHSFFFDFHMEVLLQKWRMMDRSFSKKDVLRFIEKNMDDHPEMENWSEESKGRISRTVKLLLDQIDLIDENQELQTVNVAGSLWELFIREGEAWFLEAMLLNKQERKRYSSTIT